MARDWYQLVHAEEDELHPESDGKEEWNGIQEVSANGEEGNENEEDTADPEFEDGDIDIGDDEDLFDETGKPVVIEEMATGLQQIIEKYMKKLGRKLTVYEQISTGESDAEQ